MILRWFAVLSVVLGGVIVALYLTEIGRAPWCPPWARHLRALKERRDAPPSVAPTTFDAMTALPRRAPLAVYAALEREGVALEGYVQRMERAPDGDIHLDFAPTFDPDGHLVPFVSAEVTPVFARRRHWSFERLVAAFRPWLGGPTRWDAPPRRVRLSGWRLYDVQYEGAAPAYGFPPTLASWEIHPVTRIELWSDSLARFVELAP